MPPAVEEALSAILRWAFTFVAGYLVEHGIWTAADAKTYVAGAALAVLGLAWSLWSKYKSRIKFLTALMMEPGSTENDVNNAVSSETKNPSVMTPKDVAPVLPPEVAK